MNLYKIYKEAKPWEKEMFFVAKRFEKEEPYNIYRLNKCLEDVAKKYIQKGLLQEGAEFAIPMKTGDSLVFRFYQKETELEVQNTDGTVDKLLRKGDNGEREQEVLQIISRTYQKGQLGIGEQFPEKLQQLLQEVKSGEILAFPNYSYVCVKNDLDRQVVEFQIMPVSIGNHSIKEFKAAKHITIDFNNNIAIQNFYDNNKNLFTSRAEVRINILTTAQEWINKIVGTLSVGETKQLQLGDVKCVVQRQAHELLWYDINGHQVEEGLIKQICAWFQITPVEKIIQHKNDVSTYEDVMFLEELEKLYGANEFVQAYEHIQNYCIEQSIVYQEKSYIVDQNEISPRAFGFTYKDDQFRIFELFYQENNFSKPIRNYKLVSREEFLGFCQQKYATSYRLLYRRNEENIRQHYQNLTNTPIQEKIINDTANTLAKIELESNPFISNQDIQKMDISLEALLSTYDENDIGLDDI